VDTAAAPKLVVEASAAIYESVQDPAQAVPGERPRTYWQRVPLKLSSESISTVEPQPRIVRTLYPGLELFCRVRDAKDGISAITVVLVNKNTVATGEPLGTRDRRSFLQVGLRIFGSTPKQDPFVERRSLDLAVEDTDLEAYRLLYRDARSFAVGH